MYNLLAKLILVTALLQLGWTLSSFQNCHSRQCLQKIEKLSRDILSINWQPISAFPEDRIVIENADHGMEIPGDPIRTIEIFKQVTQATDDWIKE